MRLLIALLALFLPAAAIAEGKMALDSEILVEHVITGTDGKTRVALEPPKVVTPGDKLAFILTYRNGGAEAVTDFVLTNPVPQSVAFAGTDSSGAEFSVDGGKSWGQLVALKVAAADGTSREATNADVTHVRWKIAQAIPTGGKGQLSFRGVVK